MNLHEIEENVKRRGYIINDEISFRESDKYYYVIKYNGPSLFGDNIIEYVGEYKNTSKLSEARLIGNIVAANVILRNMKEYYSSNPKCVHIIKVEIKETELE